MDGAHHHDAHLYGAPDPNSEIALAAQNAHLNPDMAEELAKEYAQITKIFSSTEGPMVHEDHEHPEQPEGHIPHDQQIVENPEAADSQSLDQNIQLDAGLESFTQAPLPTTAPAPGICMVRDCTNPTRPRGKLCQMHQKRRDRKQPLEFKDASFAIKKGRPPLPFSKSNRRKKLRHIDDLLNKYAGSREEGTKLLKYVLWKENGHNEKIEKKGQKRKKKYPMEYLESSHCTRRFSEDNAKAYEQIGRNLTTFIKELPHNSMVRQPLIQAIATGLTTRELKDVIGVSESTIVRGKQLAKEDNLLLQMSLKPINGKNVPADLLEALL